MDALTRFSETEVGECVGRRKSTVHANLGTVHLDKAGS